MPIKLAADTRQWFDSYEAMKRQIDPTTAGYDPIGGIKSGTQACANCNWFIEPGACLIVAGEISPTGLSNQWMADVDGTEMMDDSGESMMAGMAALRPSEPKKLSDLMGKDFVSGMVDKVKDLFGVGDKSVGMVWSLKEMDDGRLRFFCAPTNCFQDREGDIFTTAAHKDYVEWADNKAFYPEMWVWHTPGTRFGQVDWMDVSNGVLVASGLIDEGQEDLARSFKSDDGMSHGYIYADTKEGIVDKYWSYEFSVLPRKHSANLGGMYNLLEDTDMAFRPEKKAYLKEKLGASDETITQWEQGSEQLVKSMKDLGIAWKDDDAQVEAAVVEQASDLAQLGAQVQQLITAVGALAGTVVETKELAVKANTSLDTAVAESIRSQVAMLPQGDTASTRDSNVIGEQEAKPALDWFGGIMDKLGKTVGA